MARIRSIKPDFFKNEDMAEMSAMIRLLFIGLWTQADREGRLQDRPKRLKAELFPYDNIDVDKCLTDLHNAGFIVRYKVDVKVSAPEQPTTELALIQVVNFLKHQVINVKEQPSTLPAPNKHSAKITGKEGKGEGKEGEGNARIEFEKVYVEVMGSTAWIESICMLHKRTIPWLTDKLDFFLKDLKNKNDYEKGIDEVKKHFCNWIRIEAEKEPKTTDQTGTMVIKKRPQPTA